MITGPIKIGAVDYTIELQDKLEDDDYGCCDPHTQTITLSKDQNRQAVGDTLLHEIMHAIWHESGLFAVKRPDEEQIVRTTSTWLCLVFRDNPKVLSFIKDPGDNWPYSATPKGDKTHG